MQEGYRFLHTEHLVLNGKGLYLPYADIPGIIFNSVYALLPHRPELRAYVPRIEDVDFYLIADEDEDTFMLSVSPAASSHILTRGLDREFLQQNSTVRFDFSGGSVDLTDSPLSNSVFDAFNFERGFTLAGRYSHFVTDAVNEKERAADRARAVPHAAELILGWANRRREAVENSRIFLSHKGANKPLIEKVDAALRLIGLRTWFDKDDLAAGDTLVRGVDNAFAQCSAAVFFISSEYVDAGVIGKEIERAIHEAAMRDGGFRIIPLVLAQHGGTGDRVPDPLKTLVWKTVEDIDVVPTILRSLPPQTQAMVRYTAPK